MDYWHKQTINSPLFPDLAWDKPERRDQAGRLLIIGGNLHGFAAVGKAYEIASANGVGSIRIVLPDCLRAKLKAYWTDAIFCPSTPSGSFALDSKELILGNTLWADAVLLPGDLGRNSETAVVLDHIIASIKSPIVITKDTLDYYLARPEILLSRPNTTVVASFSQLQKMLSKTRHKVPLTYTMGLVLLVEQLAQITTDNPCAIVTTYEQKYVVAVGGQVSTTDGADKELWRLETASKIAVNLLHFPGKTFEALTHSVL
jgi:ADP-dependent NAD(P)H-hydrate dehydratase / NAD(P)H-hydrate epimerase